MEDKIYNPYKSIYVADEKFWEKVQDKIKRPDIDRGTSQIILRLLEMWLDGEVLPYPENEKGE